ncbi:MAG TPA: tripartite tricarboxylate transporter substrate binding protein [Usitatibacter sp.]|jgi:tripartite-type tricarboxylate transporter receptor subunit TctC|nr:tripartite tricarboxylate transporter substrate binding protein [Usitatibacter sp.]
MVMRAVSRMLALAFAALALVPAAAADAWPDKPVKIIVPFAAGGATDVVARLLAQKLNEAWNQPVVVEDRAGAGGNIGGDAVAHAPADGYTLLMTSGSIVTANPFMYRSMSFDPAKDLVGITNVATGPQVIAVANNVPAKTLAEFIAYVKANPGKVNFGSAGVGTQTHLAAENFAYSAGLEMTHIPYKGEAAALTDLVGGQIQMVTPNLGGAINLIKGGKIRALAVTSRERSSELPDVPAAAETIPGFENAGWFGLMAPTGTPRNVIDKVYRDTAKILQSPEFKAQLAKQGMVPVGNSPKDFEAAIREESKRWEKVIHDRGLKAG